MKKNDNLISLDDIIDKEYGQREGQKEQKLNRALRRLN
jgi:hypothetical protein